MGSGSVMKSTQMAGAVKTGEIRALPVRGIRDVFAGDSIADLIVDALALGGLRFHEGDILVVKHKIVSKAEGRSVALDSVKPSAAARRFAARSGNDARVVELALREAKRVVRQKHILITETEHGLVCANSGVDVSNVDGGKTAVLLPADADRSAAQIHRKLKKRTGLHIPVILADSFGRPWREGLCEVAIGVAGMKVIHDYRGSGRSLRLQNACHGRSGSRRAGVCRGAGLRQRFTRSGLYNPGLSVSARKRQRAADGASGREGFVSMTDAYEVCVRVRLQSCRQRSAATWASAAEDFGFAGAKALIPFALDRYD